MIFQLQMTYNNDTSYPALTVISLFETEIDNYTVANLVVIVSIRNP